MSTEVQLIARPTAMIPEAQKFEVITDYGPDTPEERELKMMIAELHQAYLRDAQPYIDRLALIQAMKSPCVFLVPRHDN